MRRLTFHLCLLSTFLVLTLVLTYPLITHITTHVPGSDLWAFDEYTFIWNIWWFKHALLQLHQSPLSTDFMFYPVGVSLVLYTASWLNAALALPLVPYLPLPFIRNLITLFGFVMSAYGAYLLMKFLILDHGFLIERPNLKSKINSLTLAEGAAFVAGITYAFASSKFVYAALGHYSFLNSEWIPFCILYFLKMLARPARRYGIMAGVFLALALYVEMTVGVFLALFMGVYVIGARPWRAFSAPVCVMGLTTAVLFAPLLFAVIGEFRNADYALKGWGDATQLSADLLGFVSPSALSTWAGLDWNAELVNVIQGKARFADVNTVFLGYATLALAFLGALAQRRAARVWIVGALVFALLALGPLLQINGVSTFDFDGVKVNVPLPFIILHYIPIVNANRVPNRFSIVLVLCLAVLVGYGVLWLTRAAAEGRQQSAFRGRRSVVGGLLTAVTCALLIADHLVVPLPLTDARVPSFYAQLAQDHDDYAILQLPLGWRNSFGTLGAEDTRAQSYQTIHQKRILGGNTSRNAPFKFDYFAALPIVSSLIAIEDYKTVSAEQRDFDRTYADEFIRFFDIRYVVVQPAVPGRHPYDDTRAAAMQYARDVLPLELISDADGALVYRVRQPSHVAKLVVDFGEPGSRAYRGEGWDAEEEISGARANWASARQARVFLPVGDGGAYQLTFAALPFTFPDAPPQTAIVVVNQTVRLPPLTLTRGWNTYTLDVPSSALHRGLNELVLEFAYARAPRDVLPSDDARTLAAAVDWMQWEQR